MNQVIVFPRGQLSDEDRLQLRDSGYIAVEADDPSKVVVTIPSASIATADDVLMAALSGLTCDSLANRHSVFIKALSERLKAKERKTAESEVE